MVRMSVPFLLYLMGSPLPSTKTREQVASKPMPLTTLSAAPSVLASTPLTAPVTHRHICLVDCWYTPGPGLLTCNECEGSIRDGFREEEGAILTDYVGLRDQGRDQGNHSSSQGGFGRNHPRVLQEEEVLLTAAAKAARVQELQGGRQCVTTGGWGGR